MDCARIPVITGGAVSGDGGEPLPGPSRPDGGQMVTGVPRRADGPQGVDPHGGPDVKTAGRSPPVARDGARPLEPRTIPRIPPTPLPRQPIPRWRVTDCD